MGKIKKLLENELVGGVQSTDLYPITSTKAVYDENNNRLDNILGDLNTSVADVTNAVGIKFTDFVFKETTTDGYWLNVNGDLSIFNDNPNYSVSIPIKVKKGDRISLTCPPAGVVATVIGFYLEDNYRKFTASAQRDSGTSFYSLEMPSDGYAAVSCDLTKVSGLVLEKANSLIAENSQNIATLTTEVENLKNMEQSITEKVTTEVTETVTDTATNLINAEASQRSIADTAQASNLTKEVSNRQEENRTLSSRVSIVETGLNDSIESLNGKENVSNKTSTLNSSSTQTQYPTAKVVYDSIQSVSKRIDNVITDIEESKEAAILDIQNKGQETLDKLNNQQVSPDMLSQATKDYINAAGGGTITNLPDDEDITEINNTLQFKNRQNDSSRGGKGYVILRTGKDLNSQISEIDNTIFEVRYDFNLNGETIRLGNNCVLLFNGGSFYNGNLVLNDTLISSPLVKIFGDNLTLSGSFQNTSLNFEWFGAKGYRRNDIFKDTINTLKEDIIPYDSTDSVKRTITNSQSCNCNIFIFNSLYYVTEEINIVPIDNYGSVSVIGYGIETGIIFSSKNKNSGYALSFADYSSGKVLTGCTFRDFAVYLVRYECTIDGAIYFLDILRSIMSNLYVNAGFNNLSKALYVNKSSRGRNIFSDYFVKCQGYNSNQGHGIGFYQDTFSPTLMEIRQCSLQQLGGVAIFCDLIPASGGGFEGVIQNNELEGNAMGACAMGRIGRLEFYDNYWEGNFPRVSAFGENVPPAIYSFGIDGSTTTKSGWYSYITELNMKRCTLGITISVSEVTSLPNTPTYHDYVYHLTGDWESYTAGYYTYYDNEWHYFPNSSSGLRQARQSLLPIGDVGILTANYDSSPISRNYSQRITIDGCSSNSYLSYLCVVAGNQYAEVDNISSRGYLNGDASVDVNIPVKYKGTPKLLYTDGADKRYISNTMDVEYSAFGNHLLSKVLISRITSTKGDKWVPTPNGTSLNLNIKENDIYVTDIGIYIGKYSGKLHYDSTGTFDTSSNNSEENTTVITVSPSWNWQVNDVIKSDYLEGGQGTIISIEGSKATVNTIALQNGTREIYDGLIVPFVNGTSLAGVTKDRPKIVTVGTCFFDSQLAKPIWCAAINSDGSITWVDSNGLTV